jgi:transposase
MADAMYEAMLDARQEGGSYRRIEVITGQRRRRHWKAEEKARIVAESFEEGGQYFRGRLGHGVFRGCSRCGGTSPRRQTSRTA